MRYTEFSHKDLNEVSQDPSQRPDVMGTLLIGNEKSYYEWFKNLRIKIDDIADLKKKNEIIDIALADLNNLKNQEKIPKRVLDVWIDLIERRRP